MSWTDSTTPEAGWVAQTQWITLSSQLKIYDESGTAYDTSGVKYDWRLADSPDTKTEDLIWTASTVPEAGWVDSD